RFEREGAFGALDWAFLQVVEARAAGGADTLCSEISLDQLVASHPEGFSKAGSFATRAPLLSKRFWTPEMPASSAPKPLLARRSPALKGVAQVPGDKSISHRALILGALAVGETTISGLLEAGDVLNTAAAMRAFGAAVERDAGGIWHIWGRGV